MRYHNITKDDMLNGDGLRVVLWVAGCSHRCRECHNPLTWDPDGGLLFDEAARQEILPSWTKSIFPESLSPGRSAASGQSVGGAGPYDGGKGKISEQDHLALHRGCLGKHFAGSSDAVCGCAGGRRIPGGEKDPKLLWKGSFNQRVIDVQASLRQPDPLIPALHCGDYAGDGDGVFHAARGGVLDGPSCDMK